VATLNDPAPDCVRLAAAPRWVAPLFAVLGTATLPWTAYLAMTLPQQAHTHHYRLAWVGFDAMLIVVLLLTAYVAWRGNRLVGLLATITATMLVVDAWFDTTTANRADRPMAILSAALVELPLAVLCGWIALHVDQVIERRLRRLARRAVRLSASTETAATALARVRSAQAGARTAELDGRAAEAGVRAAERTVSEAEKRDPAA
jgi:hypothetical protein